MRIQGGVLKCRLNLPRQAVSLLRIELRQAPTEQRKGKQQVKSSVLDKSTRKVLMIEVESNG